MTTQKEYIKLSDSEKKKEDWMNAKWRRMQPVGQSVTTTYGSPSAGGFGASSSFNSPTSNSFGSSSGFGASASSFDAPSRPATGKAAKFADPNPDSVFDRG